MYKQTALWLLGLGVTACVVALLGADRLETWVAAWFCLTSPMMVAIDYAEKRLPDLLTLPTALACLGTALTGSAVTGDWTIVVRSVSSMVLLSLVFFILFVVGKGAFGFGDVKLGLSMGASLGAFSYTFVVWGVFFGFLYGALIGLVLMVCRKATRHTGIAFGPYLIFGTLTMFFFGRLS